MTKRSINKNTTFNIGGKDLKMSTNNSKVVLVDKELDCLVVFPKIPVFHYG